VSSDEINLAIEVDADKAISSLEDYLKALEDVEKSSDIDLGKIIDALEDTGKGAEDVTKPLEDLGKGFEDITSVSEDASKSIEDIAKSFEEGSSASEQLASTITEAGSGVSDFASSAETGAGSLTELVASFEEGSGAADTLNQGMTELPGVIDETANSSAGLSTELENTGGAFTETSTSATETAGAVTEANTAITETGSATAEATTGISEMTSATTEAATGVSEFTTTTTELGTAIAEVSPAITETTTGLTEFNTSASETAGTMTEISTETTNMASSFTEAGTAVEESSSGFKTFDQNVGASIGFMGTAASSAVGLVTGFVRLDQAQNRVQLSANKVSKAQEALGKAQGKLNTLRASGTATAQELAQAELDVTQAASALSSAQGNLDIRQQNLNLRMTEFYATIGPNIIQTVTGIIASASQVPQAFGNIVGALGRVSGAFRGGTLSVGQYNAGVDQSIASNESYGQSLDETGDSANEFGNDIGTTAGGMINLNRATKGAESGSISFGRAIGITAAIVGTAAVAIGLISQNTFGLRDAFNTAGEAVGNAIPPLKGILAEIQRVGKQMGLTGDDAINMTDKISTSGDALTTFAEDLGATWEATFTGMSRSSDKFISTVGDSMNQIGTKFKDVTISIQNETSNWINAFSEFGAALERGDYSKALDLIVAGFQSVGVVALDVMSVVGTALEEGLTMLGAWVVEWAGPALLGLAQEAGTRLGNALLGGLEFLGQSVKTFVHDNVTQHFINLGASIQAELGKYQAFWSKAFATFVSSAETAVNAVVGAINGIATDITNQAAAFWANSGLGEFFDKAVNTAVSVGQQIAAALIPSGGGPKPGEKTQPQAVPSGNAPRGPRQQEDPSKRIVATTNAVKQLTPALNQATTSFGSFSISEAKAATEAVNATNTFRPFTTDLTGVSAASGRGSAALGKLGSIIRPFTSDMSGAAEATGRGTRFMYEIGSSAQSAVAPTTALTGNFARAATVMPGFNTALSAAKNVVAELPPAFLDYGNAIQVAEDHGVQLTDTTLKSIPATQAAAGAIQNLSGQREKELGAAAGTIAMLAPEADLRGMTSNQILDYAKNLELSKAAIDAERNSRVENTRASLQEQSAEKVSNDLLKARAQSYVGLNAVLSDNVVANQAIIDEFQPLNQGMKDQNDAIRAVQQAYALMTPEKVKNVVALQKEAQALALNNILQEGSQRATIALAVAQTEGVKSGVEFANSQFTAQASLQGYRAALSEAISGNTEYANSLGLTTQQLEQALSFQNDVVAAQEAIIDSGADLVHSQTVQIEAWRTMSQEQLNNVNAVNSARQALISLNSPLADNASNMQAMNEAFLAGGEAANAFVLGLRTSSAESAGYKQQLNALIPAQERVADTAQYTTEQMERLATAFSGTAEGARQMQGAMLEAASSFIGMLKFDPEELQTNVSDAFKDVPDWIRDTMSENLQEGIVAQGDIERLGKQFVDMTGAAIVGAFRTDNPFEEIKDFAGEMLEVFDDLSPEVQAALEPVRAELEKLAVDGGGNITRLGQIFTQLATEVERARSPFPPLVDEMNKLVDITPQMASQMAQLDGGLANLAKQGASVGLELGKVGQAAEAGQVPIVKLTDAASGVTTTFANVNGQLVPVNQGLSALVGPAQLAGNALLGVGAFANAAVIRFGDIQEAIANTGTAMSLLTNIFGIGLSNTITVVGAHVTTLNTYFTTTIPMALMATQNAWVLFSTTFINNFAIMIEQSGLHVITLNTYFTQTIPMALMATQNAWVLFSTTFITNFAIMIEQAAAHVTTLNTYFLTTIPMALMAAQNAWVTFSSTFLANFAIMIAQAGAHVTTINTYFTQTIPQALTTGASAFTTSTNAMSTSVLTLRNNVQQAASNISTSMGQITSATSSMASTFTSSMNTASTSALTLRNNVEQMASDMQSDLSSAASHAQSFASAVVSSFNRVGSAASSAASQVKSLASAINSLKDKTVTVTTRYVTTGKPGGAQHGGSFIVDSPTKIAGVNVGEHHKPELINVIPLTNPNVNSDRTIDLGRLSNTPSPTGLQRGGSIAAIPGCNNEMMKELIREVRIMAAGIKSNRFHVNVMMDGKKIDERIQIRRGKRINDFG
jgi:methyl-accepting chemotaxis protein